jgi:nucleoside-diphosphate-sugar epimerase
MSPDMNDKISVLVTGCDGFIGRHLVPYLASHGHKVIAASRTPPAFEDLNILFAQLPDLSVPFDWEPVLQNCDAVVHLAGIAHTFAEEDLFRLVHRSPVEFVFGI